MFIGASMGRATISQLCHASFLLLISGLQEIVFIGASMERAAIEEQLDSALLTDAGELVQCIAV